MNALFEMRDFSIGLSTLHALQQQEQQMLTTTMNRVKARLRDSGIPATTLAFLVGVSPSSMSAALRDITYLGVQREADIEATLVRLEEYRAALEPFGLPADIENIRKLITSEVTVEQVQEFVAKVFNR